MLTHICPRREGRSPGDVFVPRTIFGKIGTGVPELILLCCAESGRESPENLSEKIFMIAFSEGVF